MLREEQGVGQALCREASISQGLLLSEFRIKGLRREEVQRKWMLDTLLNGLSGLPERGC